MSLKDQISRSIGTLTALSLFGILWIVIILFYVLFMCVVGGGIGFLTKLF